MLDMRHSLVTNNVLQGSTKLSTKNVFPTEEKPLALFFVILPLQTGIIHHKMFSDSRLYLAKSV